MVMKNEWKLEKLLRYYPTSVDERDDRLTISISGKLFLVQNRQLRNFPDSLLGDEDKRKKFYNPTLNVYQFNRHPSIFESILYYYLNPGMLIRPVHIEPEIFYAELQFWEIDSKLIETFLEDDMIPLVNIRELPSGKWRCLIWKILTYPNSLPFPYGECFIGIDMIITIASCLPLMSEIVPTVTELNKIQSILNLEHIAFPLYLRVSYIVEIISILFFTLELNLRILSAPRLTLLFNDIFNLLDLIIILSGGICLINYHLHNIRWIKNFLSIYYYFLLLKSFRIYRLGRHLSNLRLLYKSLILCFNELCSLIIYVTFSMLFFGLLLYIIENSEVESNTRNLLDGFWLAFITLTTLGYGDIYPRSFEARLVAGLCALCGIIIFSLSTTIVLIKYTTLVQNQWKLYRNIRYITCD